jgi:radical SAM enzyme (TIGR01210 family)
LRLKAGSLTNGPEPEVLIGELRKHALNDEGFRSLLLSDPGQAMADQFGEVPAALRGVTFRPRPVDRIRVRPDGSGGRQVIVRLQRGDEPISAYVRTTLGVPELVIALYTKRCKYQCAMCVLPKASALSLVPKADIARQVDSAFALVAQHRFPIRRISFGNEGSPLDARTLPADHLEMILQRCANHPGVSAIVIETRAEFATEQVLDQIQEWSAPCQLTLKIGLESADDRIREHILRKRMDLGAFEATVRLMGQRGIRLSAYVLVKADPEHDDAAGRADALATCDYLKRLGREAEARLELRVNAMYRAEGSRWSDWAAAAGWTPPSIFDLAEVLYETAEPGVEVFAGLSEEGYATADGHYPARADYLPWARQLLERYNETGDLSLLREVATFRATAPRPGPARQRRREAARQGQSRSRPPQ